MRGDDPARDPDDRFKLRYRSTVRIGLGCIALSTAALVSAAVCAQDGTHAVHYCFNNWAPYAVSDKGNTHGISVDILTEASKRAGLVPRFTELPWKRCLQSVQDGTVDAVVDAAERAEFLQGPTSYSVYSNTIWVRGDSEYRKLNFADLRDRLIGLVNGYNYPPALKRELTSAGIMVEYAVDDETNIRKLAFGRVDAILADFVSTRHIIQSRKLSLRALIPTHSQDRLYPSFNKRHVTTQRAIDQALRAMTEDGVIDRIYRNHIGITFDAVLRQFTNSNSAK